MCVMVGGNGVTLDGVGPTMNTKHGAHGKAIEVHLTQPGRSENISWIKCYLSRGPRDAQEFMGMYQAEFYRETEPIGNMERDI